MGGILKIAAAHTGHVKNVFVLLLLDVFVYISEGRGIKKIYSKHTMHSVLNYKIKLLHLGA